MKKQIILAAVLTIGMAVSVNAEPLARLETSYGNIEVLGGDVTSKDGKDYLVVLLNYENTEDESAAPEWEMNVKAFLDGIEMEHGHIYDFSYEGFKKADTNIRPGASLNYYTLFELEGDGFIEVEVSPLMNWNNESASCEIDLSETGYTPSAAEKEAASDETVDDGTQTENKDDAIAELEERITALEERVAALENL